MEVTLATYNIHAGGRINYDSPYARAERLPRVQKVVEAINADVVGFVDTFGWDVTTDHEAMAEACGYNFFYNQLLEDDTLTGNGNHIGVAFMSRLALRNVTPLQLNERKALKATVGEGDDELDLIVFYLNHANEDIRLGQAKALGSYIDMSRNQVAMGDGNTVNPEDPQYLMRKGVRTLGRGAVGLSGVMRSPKLVEHGKAVLEMERGEVIPYLCAKGLIDAGAASAIRTWPSFAPLLRIDYALHTPSVQIQDFQVYTHPLTRIASDHRPLSFTAVTGADKQLKR